LTLCVEYDMDTVGRSTWSERMFRYIYLYVSVCVCVCVCVNQGGSGTNQRIES